MNEPHGNSNVDLDVVKHFGNEWHSFDNEKRPQEDLRREFDGYFSIFPQKNFLLSAKFAFSCRITAEFHVTKRVVFIKNVLTLSDC